MLTINERQAKIALTLPEAQTFAKKCFELFGLPSEVFYQKFDNGRPLKSYNRISLSDIKRAIAFRLRTETVLTLNEIAHIVGFSDHTSVITSCRKAVDYIECNDVRFTGFYRKIEGISL